MTNTTWALAIKKPPQLQEVNGKHRFHCFHLHDPSFDAITCLHNPGNKPRPITILLSGIGQRPIAIHNVNDLGSTKINQDLFPIAISGFGSYPMAITFNPQALFRKMVTLLLVPTYLEDLLEPDSIKPLSNNDMALTPAQPFMLPLLTKMRLAPDPGLPPLASTLKRTRNLASLGKQTLCLTPHFPSLTSS